VIRLFSAALLARGESTQDLERPVTKKPQGYVALRLLSASALPCGSRPFQRWPAPYGAAPTGDSVKYFAFRALRRTRNLVSRFRQE
jgi:hypothetical protein